MKLIVLNKFEISNQKLFDFAYSPTNQYGINQDCYRIALINKPVNVLTTNGVTVGETSNKVGEFLKDYYLLDSVGWGSPFLLVPVATSVDNETLSKLAIAKENDLYLSDISPLGVPFNNLKENTKDIEKQALINKGRPGSSCPKKFVALNKEFKENGICTASREYQYLKIKELDQSNLPSTDYQNKYNKIIEKSCTCVGLGTSALLAYDLDTKTEGKGVSVCPGPNIAYFSNIMSLKDITSHIYGRSNMISRADRPHMFIKELNIYIEYLKNKLEDSKISMDKKQEKYLLTFTKNLEEGISYYQNLFLDIRNSFQEVKSLLLNELELSNATLQLITLDLKNKDKI